MGVDLVGLYWTVSGPVVVHIGREWSYFTWEDRCAEAVKVGFKGLGLWSADIEHQLEKGATLESMANVWFDHGLKHLELEFLADFFTDPGTPERAASDKTRKLLFDAASAFGADHVKVGNIPGTPCEHDKLIERYAALCEDAAHQTDAKVLYEFMPFDVNVHDLDTAIDLVTKAGAKNGGLVIDTWHMAKLGIAPDDLRKIPLEYLSWIELSDGKLDWIADDDHIDEVVNHRNLPGEGEFDIRGYVDAAIDHGYTRPWGVEVLSEELRNNEIDVIFKRAYDATAAQFRTTPAPA